MKKLLVILLAVSLIFLFLACGPVGFKLTLTINGNGTVTVSPVKDLYDTDEVVTLTPNPGSGQAFTNWTGTNASQVTDNGNGTYSITMNSDKTLVANFGESSNNVTFVLEDDLDGLPDDALFYFFMGDSNLVSWDGTYISINGQGSASEFENLLPATVGDIQVGANNTGTAKVDPGTYDFVIGIKGTFGSPPTPNTWVAFFQYYHADMEDYEIESGSSYTFTFDLDNGGSNFGWHVTVE